MATSGADRGSVSACAPGVEDHEFPAGRVEADQVPVSVDDQAGVRPVGRTAKGSAVPLTPGVAPTTWTRDRELLHGPPTNLDKGLTGATLAPETRTAAPV
jgi:hypothetical protein